MSSGVVESFMRHYFLVTVSLTQLFFGLWTLVDGQFGWGGTRLKGYQTRPKVGSGGTEIHCRV